MDPNVTIYELRNKIDLLENIIESYKQINDERRFLIKDYQDLVCDCRKYIAELTGKKTANDLPNV